MQYGPLIRPLALWFHFGLHLLIVPPSALGLLHLNRHHCDHHLQIHPALGIPFVFSMISLYPGHGHGPCLCQLHPGVRLEVLVHLVVRKQQLLDGAASGPTAGGGQRVAGVYLKRQKCCSTNAIKIMTRLKVNDSPWFEQDQSTIPSIFKSSCSVM